MGGWLARWSGEHQDRQLGSWAAVSMSQRYEPDSLQIGFMQDVATAFAGLGIARLITYRMVAHHAPKDSKSPGTDPRL